MVQTYRLDENGIVRAEDNQTLAPAKTGGAPER